MPTRQPGTSASLDSGSSENLNKNVLEGFRLKPIGTGPIKNTLVESDSLSSYSWPEETIRNDDGRRQSDEQAAVGVTEDSSTDAVGVSGESKPGDLNSHYKQRDICVHITNGKLSGPNQELTYIQAYMKFMYWTCICPFDPMKSKEAEAEKIWCYRVLGFLQKGFKFRCSQASLHDTLVALFHKADRKSVETFCKHLTVQCDCRMKCRSASTL